MTDQSTTEIETIPHETAIIASDIRHQVATAKEYPRDLDLSYKKLTAMVTTSKDIAASCLYALPRGGKNIEGASIRFAEMLAHTWGNCRVASRIVDEDERFVVAEGVFVDMESNVAVSREVRRSIIGEHGRYSDSLIMSTSNAACSIAMRNAILSGIPKALWEDVYLSARTYAVGDPKDLPGNRQKALNSFAEIGISEEQILATLGVKTVDAIGLGLLATLRGMWSAIKSGEITKDGAFPPPSEHQKNVSNLASIGKDDDKPTGDRPTDEAIYDLFNEHEIPDDRRSEYLKQYFGVDNWDALKGVPDAAMARGFDKLTAALAEGVIVDKDSKGE